MKIPEHYPLKFTAGSNTVRTMDNLEYEIDDTVYLVPKNILIDGASVPRFLWSVYGHPFSKRLLPGACLHDSAYSGELLVKTKSGIFTHWKGSRKEADTFLRQILKETPTHTAFNTFGIYRGVRLGGWKSWNKQKKFREERRNS